MSLEVSLPALEDAIRGATGSEFRLSEWNAVSGGSIHQSISVSDGRARYFVKLNEADARPIFDAEADGLAAIATTGAFLTPAVVASGEDDVHAFLILEHLDLKPLQTPEHGERFAHALAQMHASHGSQFGWHHDNFIGSTPQQNTEMDNWAQFFVRHRLQPQFALAKANGFNGELQQQGMRLMARVPALFLEYRPAPSLLHGDLWHGNAGVSASGEPVIFDPAVHYGDRESDLAMCELFGGFPAAFYSGYRRASRLSPDYETRKPLYQLYHVLNHLNLFGRGYLREAERLAKRLDHAL